MQRGLPAILVIISSLSISGDIQSCADELRLWASNRGVVISAEFVSASDGEVVLKLKNGREASVPIERLSDADIAYVEGLAEQGRAFSYMPFPEETGAPKEINVAGGPELYQTPHFEFQSEQSVSKGFIAEAALVYEGTYYALRGILPESISLNPPQGQTHYRGKFLSDRAFDEVVRGKMPVLPGQRIAGLYVTLDRELLVPYSSLGARKLGSRLTLRKSSDTTTLIHEIVHQVMHDWLPLLPTWFAEGMSEYVAAIPYQNGRFEFFNSERGLLERLAVQYGVNEGQVRGMRRPSEIMRVERFNRLISGEAEQESGVPAGMALNTWGGTIEEYRDSMLLLYFFVHLDERERPGAPLGGYLQLVDDAMEMTKHLEDEVEKYEVKRLAYNEEVKRFNAALDQFRKEADGYNSRVQKYNAQAKQGVPEAKRAAVGAPPEAPVLPEELSMPDVISNALTGGTLDLVGYVQKKALPGLLKGRKGEEIDKVLKESFSEIGVQISYNR